MKYRKLDSGGDYVFGHNMNDFITDTDAVAQAIKTTLQLLEGEWWEDTSIGLPLFQNILGMPGTPENIQAADLLIQGAISNVQGVKSISDFQSSYANRTYSMRCTVDTIYGTIEVEEAF
jgi:hypothetical protein